MKGNLMNINLAPTKDLMELVRLLEHILLDLMVYHLPTIPTGSLLLKFFEHQL